VVVVVVVVGALVPRTANVRITGIVIRDLERLFQAENPAWKQLRSSLLSRS
jgi:hypothetical protein